ncbi:hypothetical protein ES703_63132 [subsurface metagenome]
MKLIAGIVSIVILLALSLVSCTSTPSPTPEPAPIPEATSALPPETTPTTPAIDEPNLSEDEVCTIVWAKLPRMLPTEYEMTQFNPATREATYESNGKWTLRVFGLGEDTEELPVVTYEKPKDEQSEFFTDSYGIEHYSSWVEEHSCIVTSYTLKLTAQYYEKTSIMEITEIKKQDVQSETISEEIPIPDPERKGLRLNWIKSTLSGSRMFTQGSVTNIGQVPLKDVLVEITHYDLNHKFVRTDEAALTPDEIGRNQKASFYIEIVQKSKGGFFSFRFILTSGEEIFYVDARQ